MRITIQNGMPIVHNRPIKKMNPKISQEEMDMLFNMMMATKKEDIPVQIINR
jgi:hypothetical protein